MLNSFSFFKKKYYEECRIVLKNFFNKTVFVKETEENTDFLSNAY